jgi:phage gpG-like protein
MSGIRLDGDIQRLTSTLSNLRNFNTIGLNQTLGEALRESTQGRFQNEEDPEGNKWQASIRAENEGGKTLSKTADLKNSISSQANATGFAVGTNKIYANTMQEGGEWTIRATTSKGLVFKIGERWIRKKEVKITMPKRKYIGISRGDMVEIRATLEEKIQEHVE